MRLPRASIPEWLGALPTLSLGLASVWLVVALVVGLGYASHLQRARDELHTAASYAIRDPVVRVNPHFLPVVRGVMPSFENEDMLGFLRKKQVSGKGPSSQDHFDGLVAGAVETLAGHPYRGLGVVPAQLSIHGFATHVFVHSGWLHMLATLLVFLLVAPLLERLWGRAVFAGALVVLTLVGAGVFCLVHAGANRALLGGSAVVAGLVAAAVARFRAEEVDLLHWLSPAAAEIELISPAWMLGAVWAVYELLLWWVVQGEFPRGVDNAVGYTAHATAAVAGGLLPLIISRLGWEAGAGHPALALGARAKKRKERVERFDLQKVLKIREQGDEDGAFELLGAEVERSARNRDAVTTFWQMAVERGTPERAAPGMMQLVREELRRGADEVAVALWHSLVERGSSVLLDPSSLVRLAPVIARVDGEEQAVLALEQALDDRNQGLTAAVAARAAQLAIEHEQPELAVEAARRALASKALDEGLRAELMALVARVGSSDSTRGEDQEKKEPAPNVFFEESDRSAFGEVADLSALNASFPDGVVTEAVPQLVDAEGLRIQVVGQGASSVAYGRLRAVSLVGVRGLGPKPVVLVDLLVDGKVIERPLGVIRLRGDRFDPCSLVPNAAGPLDALRYLVEGLLSRSGGRPLPDAAGAAARPVRIFESLETYHEEVLRAVADDLGT
jgi:membrane associated rhomboid family serine protease